MRWCERHRQKPKLLLVIFRAALAGCGGFGSALGLRFGLHQAGGSQAGASLTHEARIRRWSCASLERGKKTLTLPKLTRSEKCSNVPSNETPSNEAHQMVEALQAMSKTMYTAVRVRSAVFVAT